jgi:hypothetical protein
MTHFTEITGLIAAALLGYLLGRILGEANIGETAVQAYRGGKVTQRAIDIELLTQMRRQREEGDGLSDDEVSLLRDVCQALRLDDQQADTVMGPNHLGQLQVALNGYLISCTSGKLATADELRQLGMCQACFYTNS